MIGPRPYTSNGRVAPPSAAIVPRRFSPPGEKQRRSCTPWHACEGKIVLRLKAGRWQGIVIGVAMSRREMMLRVLAGKGTAWLPWAPRLDLWYLANQRAGTLPAKFRDASLLELVDEMGWGYHAIVPNF